LDHQEDFKLKEEQMNIYVGNLSYEVTEEDLKGAFDAFGQVDTVKVIKDEYSGRSKGFGFVEMQDNASAQSAIDGLDGKELKGRAIKVNMARARTEGPRSGGGRGKGRQGGGRQGGGRQGGGRQGGGRQGGGRQGGGQRY
jgi:RNA recognition motif-containing protein